MKHIAQLRLPGDLLRIFQRDLQHIVLYLFHDFLFRIAEKITSLPVDLHLDIVCLAEMVLARRDQRIFDCLKKSFLADLFFFLQNIQCLH